MAQLRAGARAAPLILATGGAGRLHLIVSRPRTTTAPRPTGWCWPIGIGAPLRELDSFQYHPTGIAWPPHLAGTLISEAARAAGGKLLNGRDERFVDELAPRDIVAAAILREIAEGRAVERDGRPACCSTPRRWSAPSPASCASGW